MDESVYQETDLYLAVVEQICRTESEYRFDSAKGRTETKIFSYSDGTTTYLKLKLIAVKKLQLNPGVISIQCSVAFDDIEMTKTKLFKLVVNLSQISYGHTYVNSIFATNVFEFSSRNPLTRQKKVLPKK